jgi:hypothetical protein
VGQGEHDHLAQALSGEWAGALSALGASAEAAPSCAGAHRARRADAGRLSPLPAGRWLLAVTQVSGTALSRSVRVTRPTVPTILSP